MADQSSNQTKDHNVIKQWAEERGGHPATVEGTEANGEAGLLRIDFPDYSGEGKLKEISWEEWFQKFDEKNLTFLYQERKEDGEQSYFCKLISGDSE